MRRAQIVRPRTPAVSSLRPSIRAWPDDSLRVTSSSPRRSRERSTRHGRRSPRSPPQVVRALVARQFSSAILSAACRDRHRDAGRRYPEFSPHRRSRATRPRCRQGREPLERRSLRHPQPLRRRARALAGTPSRRIRCPLSPRAPASATRRASISTRQSFRPPSTDGRPCAWRARSSGRSWSTADAVSSRPVGSSRSKRIVGPRTAPPIPPADAGRPERGDVGTGRPPATCTSRTACIIAATSSPVRPGQPEAVLLRALEPVAGLAAMRRAASLRA